MERTFNTAGPSEPDDHYCIDPLTRLDFGQIRDFVDAKQYFVLRAPRQTGKTTTLLAMMSALNADGRYACVYASVEKARDACGDGGRDITAVCDAIAAAIDVHTPGHAMSAWMQTEGRRYLPVGRLSDLLRHWARVAGKPVVLLLDDIDALVEDAVFSMRHQIRSHFHDRPDDFPQSIAFSGVHDIRTHYRMHLDDGQVYAGVTPFNITAASLRMGDFTEAEVRELWGQHTAETGQVFDDAIWPELWADTAGQPWLVNALGRQVTWLDETKRDRHLPIALTDYQIARERLILRRDTHLDQLADKLREPRVHRVISALLAGDTETMRVRPGDIDYVDDLGLIAPRPGVRIANRIYQEIIPRRLAL